MQNTDPETLAETAPAVQENGDDLYHRPARLMRIASLANILSWVTLVVVVLFFVFFVTITIMTLTGGSGATILDLFPTLTLALVILLPGLFLAVILQLVSEGDYVLMDIEENTRKA